MMAALQVDTATTLDGHDPRGSLEDVAIPSDCVHQREALLDPLLDARVTISSRAFRMDACSSAPLALCAASISRYSEPWNIPPSSPGTSMYFINCSRYHRANSPRATSCRPSL